MLAWVKKLFVFNQRERDAWVERQAKVIPAGASVLDVGAGSCPYRPLFAHCKYRAHDFEKLQPHQLRGKAGYGNVDVIGDITAIPLPTGTLDVVVCTEVLEHVPEPIQAVNEMARLLKPGGVLLLTAPLGSGLHQEPYHFYGGYTPHWYRRFLSAAGFSEIKIEPNRGFFSHYGQEGLRFIYMLAPWNGWRQLLWFPVWCIALIWCPVIALCSAILERLDNGKEFTIGYHVSARRRTTNESK